NGCDEAPPVVVGPEKKRSGLSRSSGFSCFKRLAGRTLQSTINRTRTPHPGATPWAPPLPPLADRSAVLHSCASSAGPVAVPGHTDESKEASPTLRSDRRLRGLHQCRVRRLAAPALRGRRSRALLVRLLPDRPGLHGAVAAGLSPGGSLSG